MTIRSSLFLTSILGSAILLSACSGEENLQLGSRDDIVIMKNGVPIDGQNIETPSVPEAMASNDIVAPTMPEASTAEVIEKAEENITTPAEAMKEEVQKDMQAKAEETAIEPATEITMSKPVEEAAKVQAKEIVEEKVAEQADKMKTAKSLNTELMSDETIEDTVEGVKEALKPMATTPMKSDETVSEITEPEGNAAMESEVTEEIPEATPQKVGGGCYRNMLVATNNAVPVMEERRIVCAKDLTPSVVAIVQQALINRDYNIGSPDGKMGNKTLNALEAFQRKNGLAVGGVTFETLDKLNITL